MTKKSRDVRVSICCHNCSKYFLIEEYQPTSHFCDKCEQLPLIRHIINLQEEIDYLKNDIFNLRHYGENYGY
jgi:hypothetical protein